MSVVPRHRRGSVDPVDRSKARTRPAEAGRRAGPAEVDRQIEPSAHDGAHSLHARVARTANEGSDQTADDRIDRTSPDPLQIGRNVFLGSQHHSIGNRVSALCNRRLRLSLIIAGLTLGLSACQQILVGPDIPGSVGFNLDVEAQRLTDACLRSELSGPDTLQALRTDGYIETMSLGRTIFVKQSAEQIPSLFGFSTPITVSVYDTPRIACTIDVQPYTLGPDVFTRASSTLEAAGYRRMEVGQGPFGGGIERWIGDGTRFALVGAGPDSPAANRPASITLYHLDGASDPTCRNRSLPASHREGC